MRGTQFNDFISATSRVGASYFGLGGDDMFQFYSASARSKFNGGAGNDTLAGVGVSFVGGRLVPSLEGTVFNGGTGFDTIVYNVNLGGSLSRVNLSTGGAGLNSVEAQGYAIDLDLSSTSPSSFTITGTNGRDLISVFNNGLGRATALTVSGGRGNDTLELGSNFQAVTNLILRGGGGNDQITVRFAQGSDGARLDGGDGNDTIQGDVAHGEMLFGGSGRDTIVIGASAFSVVRPDTIRLGTGRDTLRLEDLDQFSLRHVGNVADFNLSDDRISVSEAFEGKVVFDDMPEAATGFDPVEQFIVVDRQEGTLSVVSNLSADIANGATLILDFGRGLNLGLRHFSYYDDVV
ncbi:hypothetical protein E7811_02365 [Aliigemmobacter aestuarii]|uniref:Calcium-binding protein n=2 Tax=Aliigemmobacter aestuarii TaxID=1445661 RepID=A0A4S3MRC1_9RHOB|nr:hypothetical protein E7811_02365 [Gemmobacter aestuarii]